MRHRTSEVQAIQEILNSEDFEDDVAMAKAVIERVYELFQFRGWYGLKWGNLAVGPFIDKAEANRAAKAMDNLPTVHEMESVDRFTQWVAKMNPKDSQHCEECNHPRFAHGFTNHVGCVVRKPDRCECTRSYK